MYFLLWIYKSSGKLMYFIIKMKKYLLQNYKSG